jgi:2-phosphosulfolactate phosphatase
VVIDVLRASTTIAVAIANGARQVIPCESAEEAVTRSKAFERDDMLLAGERKMLPIPGFDLGNSPLEFTADVVGGKTVLLTTTNGTAALVAVQSAPLVYVGALVNFSAVLAHMREHAEGESDVAIVCAGRERQFSLEDAVCAGGFVRGLLRRNPRLAMNDAALATLHVQRRYRRDLPAMMADATHAAALTKAGFGDDVACCAALDTYPVVPILIDRQITRLHRGRPIPARRGSGRG